MPKRLLPFVPGCLTVTGVQPEPHQTTIHAGLRPRPAVCLACSVPSRRKHGHCERTMADLPWQGRPVRLRIRLRRLRCLNSACPRRTFSEQIAPVAPPHARRSRRLGDVQRHLGRAPGGEAAARLAGRLAMPVSGDTLLRLVRAGPTPAVPAPRVIGLDEWAWRRGRRYGTLIVDFERNVVIDLLPDRDVGTVVDWLWRHPSIEGGIWRRFAARSITTPWSTSPVEGQISRLKMVKRSMYGRAGFALLRQRVLNAA